VDKLNYLWIYLGIINCALFITMGIDKLKAIKKAWRVPEATLFMMAILGGALGGTFGMYCFRHKTKHLKFQIGFPLLTIIEAVLFVLYIKG